MFFFGGGGGECFKYTLQIRLKIVAICIKYINLLVFDANWIFIQTIISI
jgi:hypothetical protein